VNARYSTELLDVDVSKTHYHVTGQGCHLKPAHMAKDQSLLSLPL